MAAGDASQITPVQIMHIFFVWSYSTQTGLVEQHNAKAWMVGLTLENI